jgi:hypothetical protein
MYYLVSDTRERNVHSFIKDLFSAAGVSCVTAQINTGDYLICSRVGDEAPKVHAVVERKTLSDFAASFRDGRYGNISKMLHMRQSCGCQLYFFVEGPAYTSPSRKISHTPYSNILSAMTLMMVREGVHVVQTENEMHTAKRLLDFVQAFSRTPDYYRPLIVDAVVNSAAVDSAAVDSAVVDSAVVDSAVVDSAVVDSAVVDSAVGGAAPNNNTDIPEGLLGVIPKTLEEQVLAVWSRIHGVSIVSARTLAENFTILDLMKGRISLDALDNIRLPTGSKLNGKAKKSIIAIIQNNNDGKVLLEGIIGLSRNLVSQLLQNRSLAELLELPIENIETQQKGGRHVRLGKVKAQRINKVFDTRIKKL